MAQNLLPGLLIVLPAICCFNTTEDLATAHWIDGIAATARRMLDSVEEKDMPVNVVASNTEVARAIMEALQLQANLPSSFFPTDEAEAPSAFWDLLRSRRMAWRGSVNLCLLDKKASMLTYLRNLHYRFFTTSVAGMADERRMDLIYRNVFHVFAVRNLTFWLEIKVDFESLLEESLNAVVVTFDEGSFTSKIWWSKSEPDGLNVMRETNQFTPSKGFQRPDVFPPIRATYSNLKGRHFRHAVMHKPPWNYVTIDKNDKFVEDNGGRDITILDLLGKALNFSFDSIDPVDFGIDRSRGSSWSVPDYNFSGILGKIHRREDPFHFYLGDTSQTFSRNSAAEFSFFVLADSGAFVTQAPKSYNPKDLLLKPFTLEVWEATFVTFVALFAASLLMMRLSKELYFINRDVNLQPRINIFHDTLLRTTARVSDTLVRILLSGTSEQYFIVTILPHMGAIKVMMSVWLLMTSWVLSASYGGALFSFYSIPFTMKPIDSLEELKGRIQSNFTLGMTEGSSSYEIITTGGGIYADIWKLMQKDKDWKLESTEVGMDRILRDSNFAVLEGREKLIFDTLRLGQESFHINKNVFFTKYKGIVLRNGSPLRNCFDDTLLRLFDFGLINKITQDEYHGVTKRKGTFGDQWERKEVIKTTRTAHVGPYPIHLEQIVGSLYVVGFGFAASVVALMFETLCHRKLNKC